jgi:hypothetical protein
VTGPGMLAWNMFAVKLPPTLISQYAVICVSETPEDERKVKRLGVSGVQSIVSRYPGTLKSTETFEGMFDIENVVALNSDIGLIIIKL